MSKSRISLLSLVITAASVILAIVPIFYMANIGGQMSEYPAEYIPSIVCAVLSVVVQIAGLLLTDKKFSKILDIVAAILIGIAFTFYILGGVLSLVDYFSGIVLFGDPQQAPAIIGFGIAMLLSVVLAVLTCFLRKQPK